MVPSAWYVFQVSDWRIEVPTEFQSMAEARSALEQAFIVSEVAIEHSWVGEELHLRGPGAHGQVSWQAGALIGRATLRPPASFFAAVIQNEFEKVLRRAAEVNAELSDSNTTKANIDSPEPA